MPDPPKSKDQMLIERIVARLQTILISNGFQTDIGTRVADSEPHWDEETQLPAISVFQLPSESTESPDTRRKTIHAMPVQIKTFLKRGTSAANARIAISDIKKAIRGTGEFDERWHGLVITTAETRHGIDYAPDSLEVTGAIVEINCSIINEKFNAEQ
jgi:hypothetical protein